MEAAQTAPIPPQIAIGLMSGTSLDGLDIARSRFERNRAGHIRGELLNFESVPFPDDLVIRLRGLYTADAREWASCAAVFSSWCAEALLATGFTADVIGFHGQTTFHEPAAGFTAQLASGAHLHARTGIPVVCDFRSLDVALGGQGAPLVPVADALLFPEAEVAVNLGGIANLSERDSRRAWDIVPCNLLLNGLAERVGEAFDRGGQRAARGRLIPELGAALARLPYLARVAPKSLGREDVDAHWWPVIQHFEGHAVDDLLATVTADIARQVRSAIGPRTALITGGGAWNAALMAGIAEEPGLRTLPASAEIVDGKEAHAFALLAWMRVHGLPNTWASVTGAERDSCGGCIYGDVGQLLA
jgi:anhydro-N-acetylmuramic acid kinase